MSIEGGVGAATILYNDDRIIETSEHHLRMSEDHTVYEAELIGIILALALLTKIASQFMNMVLIGLNNQATIHALNNETTKPSHHLLNLIHTAVEKLQEKQDKTQTHQNLGRQNSKDIHFFHEQRGCSISGSNGYPAT